MGHELETDAGDALQFSKLSRSLVDNLDLGEAAIQVSTTTLAFFTSFFLNGIVPEEAADAASSQLEVMWRYSVINTLPGMMLRVAKRRRSDDVNVRHSCQRGKENRPEL